MAKYELHLKDGTVYELSIVDHRGVLVSSMSFGGDSQLLKYEAPGSNGGLTLFNGRLGNTITKAGQIIGTDLQDADAIKNRIENVRINGEIVVLVAPVGNNDTGEYFIESFRYNIQPGKTTALTFTMTLYENREANLRRSAVNLVNFQESELLKDRYRALLGITS